MQEWLDDQGIDVEIQAQGETALETLQSQVLEGSGEIVSFTGDLLRELVEVSIQLILVLVLSVYMLLYGPRIGGLVRSVMPPGDGTPEDDYPTRVQKAVSGYVRGQILFSMIMGTSAGVALWIFGALGIFAAGQTYALAFGAFFGLMELIPFVGPVLGALPPMLVALFDDPLTAVWVGLLFLALQQLEGHVVAPQVFSYTLRINPLLVIFALLFGGEIYGFVGALIALPIAAVLRETVLYLRRHLVLEPWGDAQLAVVTVGGGRPPPCGECGVQPRQGDSVLPAVRQRAVALACPPHDHSGGGDQALRRPRGPARRQLHRAAGRAPRGHRAQRRRARRRCCRSSPASPSRRAARCSAERDRLGPAAAGGLREAQRRREPAAVRAAGEGRRPRAAVERALEQTGLTERARDELGTLSGGNRQRVNIAIGLLADPPVLLLDEPSSALDPRQRERVWSFLDRLAAEGTTVVFATHDVAEAARHADRVLVLADGELLFSGTPAELETTVGPGDGDFEAAFVAYLQRARAIEVRWLLSRTCRSCGARRCWSRCSSIYPIVVALLIGFALSGGPDKPKVAFYNGVPPGESTFTVGGEQRDTSRVRRPALRRRRADPRRHPRGGDREGRVRRGARRADRPARGRREAARLAQPHRHAASGPRSRSSTTPRTR